MDKNKIIKIIASIFLVPLIIFFSIGILAFIEGDLSYLITCAIIDIILILIYVMILKKEKNKKWNKWFKFFLLTILAICTCGISLLVQILIIYNEKQKNKEEEKRQKEQKLLEEGYKKIYNNLYLNDKNKMLIINDNKYGFSQIVDCELIENDSTISSTYGNTKGRIKNNGKIKSRTNTISSSNDYCNELYLNITVDDFNNPNIKLDVRGKGMLSTTSDKYKNTIKKANEMLSIFKLIISKNNEKYVENGTVTKIEHRYIQEKNYEQKLEELSRLYKDRALTDYEYSMKKQELLEKIK